MLKKIIDFIKKHWLAILLIVGGLIVLVFFKEVIGTILIGGGASIEPLRRILKKDKQKIKELEKEKDMINDKIKEKEKEIKDVEKTVNNMDIDDLVNHGNRTRRNME